MQLIGNSLNGRYFDWVINRADREALDSVVLAVAYVREMDDVFKLAMRRKVPLTLFALIDQEGFPKIDVVRRFLGGAPPSWRLFLTRGYFHPKIMWFKGVGCYIGSANLTDNGQRSNLECGVWFEQSELIERGLDSEISDMVAVIRSRCTTAGDEHVKMLQDLSKLRTARQDGQTAFEKKADAILSLVPGKDSPHLIVSSKDAVGGEAKKEFVEAWGRSLTLLRKLAKMSSEMPRPKWVGEGVSNAIAFDQATEHYYTFAVRKSRRKRDEVVEELHLANKRSPESAVKKLLLEWSAFDGADGAWEWASWCNEHPARLQLLLQRESLARLDQASLGEIVWLTHAAREHARQVTNRTLGLAEGTTMDVRLRCDVFAQYLLNQRTEEGQRTVGEVLQYVLWSDRDEPNAGARIWNATRGEGWKVPHLGPSILGELVGYAQPDRYPPRNERVIRTLYALGFDEYGAR
jgi:hypothetical protein